MLVNAIHLSVTAQLAVSQMPPRKRKLSTQSPVASESCLVRELTSPRDVQAASRPVHELSICELSSNRSEWAPLYASGYPLKCIVPLFPFGTRKLHSSPMHFPCRPVNYTLAYTECTGLALCIDTSSAVSVNTNL